MTPKQTSATGTFQSLGIAPKFLAILDAAGFVNPTPIQHQAIPPGLEGKDIVGIAQTGTGKTLAFGIPLIQRLSLVQGQALILLPTRELALQVDETFQKIGAGIGLRTAVIIGGAAMGHQINSLRRAPHVIIATPGRLADLIKQGLCKLHQVKIVVLDEADRMFDIGFAPQIKQILKLITLERQTMLFSATMPAPIAAMAAEFMRLPLRIEVAPSGTSAEKVEQELFIVSKETKLPLLKKILSDTAGTVLVFSRTKFGAKRITAALCASGHNAAEIHSNRSLAQRRQALDGFKSGRFRILVATDIAARGIDVTGIELVVNYDLPDNSEDYVHRIGRTGRAGLMGKAISLVTPDQRGDVTSIERLIRKTIPITTLPTDLPAAPMIIQPQTRAVPRHQARGFGQRRGHRSGGAARGRGRW